MNTIKFPASLIILLAVGMSSTPARAETVNCAAITALPAVITAPGIHCLTGNLTTGMTSGHAIDIQTNNVVLDLNGFKLGGLAAGTSTEAVGIHASDRQNITIKNGTVRGFIQGIGIESTGASQGHIVEDIRADQNTVVGINVAGLGSIVRNNQVVATGGSTCCADSTGILVWGNGTRVLNNDVINMISTVPGFGIARGIFLIGANGGLVVNNRITVADKGIEYASSAGKYRDNLTFSVGTPYTGGTPVGSND